MPVQKDNVVIDIETEWDGENRVWNPRRMMNIMNIEASSEIRMIDIYIGQNETITDALYMPFIEFVERYELTWLPHDMRDLRGFLWTMWTSDHFHAIYRIEDLVTAINDRIDLEANDAHFILLQLEGADANPIELGVIDEDLSFVGSTDGYEPKDTNPDHLRDAILMYSLNIAINRE